MPINFEERLFAYIQDTKTPLNYEDMISAIDDENNDKLGNPAQKNTLAEPQASSHTIYHLPLYKCDFLYRLITCLQKNHSDLSNIICCIL
jgi:hypothetical protein